MADRARNPRIVLQRLAFQSELGHSGLVFLAVTFLAIVDPVADREREAASDASQPLAKFAPLIEVKVTGECDPGLGDAEFRISDGEVVHGVGGMRAAPCDMLRVLSASAYLSM